MSEPARRAELPDFGNIRRPPTAGELEDIESRAYSEGWEKGHADGFAAGLAEARGAAQRLDAIAGALAAPLAVADAAAVEQLRELALRIGGALARHTLVASPEAVAGLLQEAVAALADGDGPVHITLHPQDRAALPESIALPESVRWHDDPDLARGDVQVQRAASGIDARLESRLRELARRWLDADDDEAAHEARE